MMTNEPIIGCESRKSDGGSPPCRTCFDFNNYEPIDTGALARQVGGSHYKDFAIQPITFIHANKLDFVRGNIIKYACRQKDGAQDIRKIIHYAELLLELEYGEKP